MKAQKFTLTAAVLAVTTALSFGCAANNVAAPQAESPVEALNSGGPATGGTDTEAPLYVTGGELSSEATVAGPGSRVPSPDAAAPERPVQLPKSETIVDEQGHDYQITSVTVPAPKAGMGTGKTLRIGIPFNYPGIGLMDEESWIPSGLDVDIAAYIAWKLGYSPYDIEWVAAPAPARVPLLQSGRVDLMVAPMTITPDRAEQVDFAGPYLVAGQDILVRANETGIHSPADLNGKSVCLLLNTTAEKRIREMLTESTEIIYGDSYVDCMHKVVDGEIDATSTDDIILAGHASTDEFFRLVKLVGEPFSEEYFGIGLPLGSHQMCLQVNAALSEMFTDGSWDKFISRNVIGTNYFPDRYDNPPTLNKCQ